MPSPNYSNIVNQVVTRLKEDSRLNSVSNDSIFTGPVSSRIMVWPAITVSLERVEEIWKSFAGSQGQKDAVCTIRLTVMDRVSSGASGYTTGLASVEDTVRIIDDIIQSDVSISGVSYQSETGVKTFSVGEYDNTPVLGSEIELTTITRFTRAN